jgi:YjbR protein
MTWQSPAVAERPDVPDWMVRRIGQVLNALPECREESAWVGTRWRVRDATVAHVFGGEDLLFRVTFRAEQDEVMALQHLGDPYFRASWGRNVVGLLLDDGTDWQELRELLTDSYCLQAPKHLAELVPRPPQQTPDT